MSKPEFEVLQERILEGLQDYARTCAEAEAWYRDWKARNARQAAAEDLEGILWPSQPSR